MPAQERLTSVIGHLKVPSGVSEGKSRILEKNPDDIVSMCYSMIDYVLIIVSPTGNNIGASNAIDESSEGRIKRFNSCGFVDFNINCMLVLS